MPRLAINEDFQLYCYVSSPKIHKLLLKAFKAAGYKFHADYLGDKCKWQFVVNANASTATGIWVIFFKCGAFGKTVNTDQDA